MNLDELEAWLATRPREDAVLIAARAVLRTFPFAAGALRDSSQAGRAMVAPPLVRALAAVAFAGVSGKEPPHASAIRSVVARAATAVAAATARAATDAAVAEAAARSGAATAEDEARATAAATRAAGYVAAGHAIDAVYSAIRAATARNPAAEALAVAASAAAAAEPGSVFAAIEADAVMLAAGASPSAVAGCALWHGAPPDMAARAWASLRARLEEGVDEKWWVWIDWIEGQIDGLPPNPALQREIVLLPDEIWQAGPAQLNAKVAELLARHPGRAAIAQQSTERAAPATIEGSASPATALPGPGSRKR